jgi:hypothetical protein
VGESLFRLQGVTGIKGIKTDKKNQKIKQIKRIKEANKSGTHRATTFIRLYPFDHCYAVRVQLRVDCVVDDGDCGGWRTHEKYR